ncbi:MAG: cysteine synthase family protein [Acholeplasmatales bacterium]|nr:cysteine synthase family protein [Acholeplasmatales bacterium]
MNLDFLKEKIGNTPLIKLEDNLYVKIESGNPFGSIKDRVVLAMIEDGIAKDKINKDTTIIEATSGNTGIGLAGVCKELGLKCIIVMPDNVTQERIDILSMLGSEVILTPSKLGVEASIDMANDMALEIPNSFVPKQFENKICVTAHFKTTGPEIFNDLPDVDIVVAGIGTGGTITGIAKYLKMKSDVYTVGVEPASSPFITKGKKASHKIQGIGAGFIPSILDLDLVDEVICITDEEAYEGAHKLEELYNVSAGISAGAAYMASLKILSKNPNKKVVFILPDDKSKYTSVL